MTTQDDIDALATEITTATGNIVSEIDTLEAQIAAGGTPNLSALRSAVTALEGVVPPVVPTG